MKKIFLALITCALLLFGAKNASATACGTTTVSTSALVDTDGFTWTNGSYVATLVLPTGVFSLSNMSCTTAGGTFSNRYTGSLSSTGTLSVALPQNTNLAPAGSKWAVTFCPQATNGCFSYTAVITGSTQTLSPATVPAPRFQAGQFNYGYSPIELTSTAPIGAVFYNTTLGLVQIYNGSTWNVSGTGLAMNALGNIVNTTSLLQDDFCGNTPATTSDVGQLGWDVTVIVTGTNPVAAAASVANHPCLITLTTNTTATNGVGITLGKAVGVLFPGNSANWQSEQIVKINQITSGSYRVGFGTVDSATGIPTNGIYFRF